MSLNSQLKKKVTRVVKKCLCRFDRQQRLEMSGSANLARLPKECRGKRYRRRGLATNEEERARAQARERAQKRRHVMSFILEAKLPFGPTLGQAKGDDRVSALSRCMGLRPRASDSGLPAGGR